MLFTSLSFLFLFLPALLILYFLVPVKRFPRLLPVRNVILLCFSLLFYAWDNVSNLKILLFSILINYVGGLLVACPKSQTARKIFLVLTVAVNIGSIGYYKYAGFFGGILHDVGVPISVPQVLLPIGISFFTFQGVSYVIDVYRKDAKMQPNPLNVALYVALFPQLVAGPIVRYTTVEKEITTRTHTLDGFSHGVERFLLGFGKKMVLANAMGEIADAVFQKAGGAGFSTALAWVGAIAYTFQIFYDFSAYSDMAIGLGQMFGFHFLENFNAPYVASSVTDFWRRWHISLSTWFRDYIYIPLGGNRCGTLRQIFNLLVVWSLTGLWHGANWTFIVWGLYFGAFLIIEKFVIGKRIEKIPAFLRHVLTLVIVMIGWVLFRSDTIGSALSYLGVMFGGGGKLWTNEAVYYLVQYLPEFILCVLAVFPLRTLYHQLLLKNTEKTGKYLALRLCALLVIGLSFVFGFMKLVTGSFNPFIYFQF